MWLQLLDYLLLACLLGPWYAGVQNVCRGKAYQWNSFKSLALETKTFSNQKQVVVRAEICPGHGFSKTPVHYKVVTAIFPTLWRCPSTVRRVFPVLVFQLSKQQNRTRTTSSTVLGTPPNRTRTKKFPLEELWGGCFLSWVLNWESTENWDFHRLEPYTKPYSDTSWNPYNLWLCEVFLCPPFPPPPPPFLPRDCETPG